MKILNYEFKYELKYILDLKNLKSKDIKYLSYITNQIYIINRADFINIASINMFKHSV